MRSNSFGLGQFLAPAPVLLTFLLVFLSLAKGLDAIEIPAGFAAVVLYRVLAGPIKVPFALQALGHLLEYTTRKLFCNAITNMFDIQSPMS